MNGRVLVAGIGNVFLGDDGFGVAVAARLAGRPLPGGVRAVDFGVRGLALGYALGDGYDGAILVDAMSRGGAPGTLYVIEPALDGAATTLGEMHNVDPASVLAWARGLGATTPGWLRVVGCEPASVEPAEELSAPVAAAVDEAVALVERLLAEFDARA